MPKKRKGYARISPRMQSFLDGEIKPEDLDDEEVRRGQLRAEDGSFRGRPTDTVPRKFHELIAQEHIRRWEQKVAQELDPALETLKQIAYSPKAPADARMKSAIYLIERRVGKIPEKAEVKMEVAKWEADIEDLIYDDEADSE